MTDSTYTTPDGRQIDTITTMGIIISDGFGDTSMAQWDVLPGGFPAITAGQDVLALANQQIVAPFTQPAIGSGVNAGITWSVTASTLAIVMGTTSGDELWFLSRKIFAGKEDLTIIQTISQMLAANSLWVGIVEVDPVYGVPVANPVTANEFNNRAGVEFGQSTGTKEAFLTSVEDGAATPASVSSTTFTSSANTSPFETLIEFRAEDVTASTTPADTATTRSLPLRLSTQRPNDTRAYKMLIRARNTAAPASSTTYTIDNVLLVVNQENRVNVDSSGSTNPQASVPVNLTGSGATAGQVQGTVSDGSSASIGLGMGIMGTMSSAIGGLATAAGTTLRWGSFFQDLARRAITKPFGNPESFETSGTVTLTGTAAIAAFAAAGAGIRHEVNSWTAMNKDSVAHNFDLKDGTTILDTMYLPSLSQAQHVFPGGLPGTANTALNITPREAVTTTTSEAVVQSYKTVG